jgi:predicted N-acetyltransferase YhbS
MEFINPITQDHIRSRNQLIQAALRPDGSIFPITQEYPIILSAQNTHFSYCIQDQDGIIAHANLWPRILEGSTGSKYRVGLVGNVATHVKWRGKGLMRRLFSHLEEVATKQGLGALVLWSDLNQFYQNLGFSSLGREQRFTFVARKNVAIDPDLVQISPDQLSDEYYEKLLKLRLEGAYRLSRSVSEFRQMLSIPATSLFLRLNGSEISAYYVIGKGYDMVSVIHEWGARRDVTGLYEDILQIATTCDLSSIMLLAPCDLPPGWTKTLGALAQHNEICPMGWVKFLVSTQELKQALGNTFIWGLDSI